MSTTDSHADAACSNLFIATKLAATGFRVFPYYPVVDGKCGCNKMPCNSVGKHPRISGYLDLATTDLEQIEKWWGRWPTAGIGICPDNQLIIDVDGPEGHAKLIDFQERMGEHLSRTFTCISGSAEHYHYHLYFRLPAGTRVLNKPLCRFAGLGEYTGIDVRSYRGQVAAPGTVHRSGQRYQWDATDAYGGLGIPAQLDDLPDAPAWLLSALGGLISTEPLRCLRVQRRPKETYSRPSGSISIEPGSNEWYLRIICDRWPIVRAGQRNCLQGKPITYLMASGLSVDRVRFVMTGWLDRFSQVFSSSRADALNELDDCIDRNQSNLDAGKITPIADHSTESASHELHPVLMNYLKVRSSDLFGGNEGAEKHSNDLSVSIQPVSDTQDRSKRQVAVLLAVMLHYQYRVLHLGEDDYIRMTHTQLQEILSIRFGMNIQRKQLYQLADQFISRKDKDGNEKPASVFELLKQTKRGYTGKPSEYRVTGLPSLASR